jgi:trigger factor
MQVTVSKPEKSQVTITIEAEEAEMEQHMKRAAIELGKQLKIDGFRQGKIPADVAEKEIGKDAIRGYALEMALPHLYAEAVIKENVQVVARPEIKIITEDPFVFEAIVAVLPEVKVKGYEKIKIEKKDTEVNEKDLNDMIDYFRRQNAENKEVDRAAKKGDKVELDFDGFDPEGDVPLEGTSSKNHPVVLGEGGLIPGFEEEVEGMKKGEEKTFNITFPKDYHSERFKGKKAKFKIKLNKVEEVTLPELNKEWIKKMTTKDMTIEEFKKDVKTNLKEERERNEGRRRETEFFEELVKCATIEIPEALIEEEIDFILDRTKMDLEAKGMQWDQYVKYLEGQKRDVREEKKEQAEKQVKLRLVLQHLYKKEGIEVDDKQVEVKLKEMMKQYPKSEHDKIKSNYKEGTPGHAQVHNNLKLEKFLEKFLS